jgi:CarD family transcriptional regulator
LKEEKIMIFSVGDKVMHPKYGAGQITGEEHRELVEGFKHYCVIKLLDTGAIAYIPMRKMDELGVRPVMSRPELGCVLETLRGVPCVLSKDFKVRQERIREKLGTCRPILIAEAIRDLTWRKQNARLTKQDENLLRQGRELLAGEIAVATDTQFFDAQEAIDAALKVAMADEPDEHERARVVSTALKPTPGTLIHAFLKRAKDKGETWYAQTQDT